MVIRVQTKLQHASGLQSKEKSSSGVGLLLIESYGGSELEEREKILGSVGIMFSGTVLCVYEWCWLSNTSWLNWALFLV